MAGISVSAQSTYNINKMYSENAYISGFSSVAGDTIFFNTVENNNAGSKYEIKYYLNGKIGKLNLNEAIEPMRIVHSGSEKFIVSNNNKLYQYQASQNSWQAVKLPTDDYQVWDVRYADNALYVFPISGDIYFSNDMGNKWIKLYQVFTEGATYSPMVFNNKMYIGKRDSLFYKEGNTWNFKLTDRDDNTDFAIEGMTANSTDLFLYDSDNRIYKVADTGMVMISRTLDRNISGLVVLDNEDVIISSENGIYIKVHGQNEYKQLYSFKNPYLEKESLRKINKLVKLGNAYAAVLPPSEFLVSNANATVWRSALINLNNVALFNIEKNGETIATVNNNGVYLSDTTSKMWYEANGLQSVKNLLSVHKYQESFVAVAADAAYKLNIPENKWESIFTTDKVIKKTKMINNELFMLCDDGLYKSNLSGNTISQINPNIQTGNLCGNDKLFVIENGIAKEINSAGQIATTYDLIAKNIKINDIATFDGKVYAASNNGLLLMSSASTFTRIENGISENIIRNIRANNNRIILIDDFDNVFYSNADVSKFAVIDTKLNKTISDLATDETNIYISTNLGAYHISNISNAQLATNDYWINKGYYLEHSRDFSEFVTPQLNYANKDITFVSNKGNTSKMLRFNTLTGAISNEVNLSEKYAKFYPNTLVNNFFENDNASGKVSLIKFAPVGKTFQDSIFKYNYISGDIELQKQLKIDGIKAESKELGSDFVEFNSDVIYYLNYQLDPNDAKTVANVIYKNDKFEAFDALPKFTNDFAGTIDKLVVIPSDAEFQTSIIVARKNNDKNAAATEKGMISIFNEAGTKNAKNINVSNSVKITGLSRVKGIVNNKPVNYLVYSKLGEGDITNNDAIVLYDLDNSAQVKELTGFKVNNLIGLGGEYFAALASMKKNNQIKHKLLFFNVNSLEIVAQHEMKDTEFGNMMLDGNSNKVLVFGEDGKLRAFNNPKDNRVLKADFYVEKKTVKVGEKVTFINTSTGNPTAVKYDFGDGKTGSSFNESHIYHEAGTYTVKLTIYKGDNNDFITKNNYITVVSDEGIYDFKASAVEGFAPFEVKFTESGTDKVIDRTWDFGDGETSKEKNPTHNYTKTGRFTVRLIASNGVSTETITKHDYIIVDPEPKAYTADFTTEYRSGVAPFAVKFYDQTKDGATEWLWDFGDGTTSTERNPIHTYKEYGSYTVSLQVAKDGYNSKTVKTRYILASRGEIPEIFVKEEIEIRDTTGSIISMNAVQNADNQSITFDVKYSDLNNANIKGKVAFYETKENVETNNLLFVTLPEALYADNKYKFITPVVDNKFNYLSQFVATGNKNFVLYNTGLNGQMINLAQKFEMKANMVPVAYNKFGNTHIGAFTLNDSSLVITNMNEGGVANVKEVFSKKHIKSDRLPLMQLEDKNYLIIYKSLEDRMKYLVFNDKLETIKTGELFEDAFHYVVDAYVDADKNIVMTGEQKFKPELEPTFNFIAKLDKNFNVIWEKTYTTTFKVSAITELKGRWGNKSYVCSGEIENNCAIFGFNDNGEGTMKLKLPNRKGVFNDVINVNNGELIFTGAVYSNMAPRYNFYALHLHKANSYSSVETSEANNELRVYPNPSNGLIHLIDLQANAIEIYDQTGSKVFEQMNPTSSYFDLSFLSNGFYSVVVKTNDGAKFGKIIINK